MHIKIFLKKIKSKITISEFAGKFSKDALWSVGGNGFSKLANMIAYIIAARQLGQEKYGILGVTLSLTSFFTLMAGGGLGIGATKFIAEYKYINPIKAGKIISFSRVFTLICSIFIAIILILSSNFIANNIYHNNLLNTPLKIGAIILFFDAINSYQRGAMIGFEAFKNIAKINSIVGLCTLVFVVIGVHFGDLYGTLVAITISKLINWILFFINIQKECFKHNIQVRIKQWYKEYSVFTQFGLPSLINSLIASFAMWFITVLLTRSNNGLQEMGGYNAVNQLKIIVAFFPFALSALTLPKLSVLKSKKNQTLYKKFFLFSIFLNTILTLIIGAPFLIFPKKILSVFGCDFMIYSPLLIFMTISVILSSINDLIGQLIASVNKMWLGFVFNTIWSIILISVTYYCLKNNLGALSLGIAYFVAYFIHLIFQSIFVFNIFRINPAHESIKN